MRRTTREGNLHRVDEDGVAGDVEADISEEPSAGADANGVVVGKEAHSLGSESDPSGREGLSWDESGSTGCGEACKKMTTVHL